MRPPNRPIRVYPLEKIRDLIRKDKVKITHIANTTANELGFSRTEIIDVVYSLEQKNFYHAVSDNKNNKSWQDVYKIEAKGIKLYIKLKIVSFDGETLLVLSFKEDTNLLEG